MRALLGAFLFVALTGLPAFADARFSDSWLLVRLVAPIDAGAAEDSTTLLTGLDEVDAVILETGVQRIERALPMSSRAPRFPEAFRRHGLDRTYRFHVPAGSDIRGLVERFSGLAGVELAEPDWIGEGGANVPNDPLFANQYGFDQVSDADVDGPEAWDVATGSETIVAVLDTGIDSDHPDLAAKLVFGFDFVNFDFDPEDDHGHGTNVGSIVSADTDNGTGVAGACWNCRIMALKVLDSSNYGFYSDWADAMVWATDAGVRVINLSAGGTSPSATLLAGVQYAFDAGVIHVSITHNDDANVVRYPGAYAETITVGATDALDQRADPFCYSASSGSNFGDEIDVVAPGELILGAAMGGGYNSWCGTSQAAPLVAGLLGIMRTIYPSLGREEARFLLHAGAEDQVGRPSEDTAGFDIYHGWGRVNMEQSLLGTVASTSLRVEGTVATRPFFATPNPLANSYDFIRGSLDVLSEDAAGVDLGSVVCLENDSTDPDTLGNEDHASPPPGEAFFYLGRFDAAPGPGWYGGSSLNRDRRASAGDCPACGNHVCEISAGEDCLSCPADCNGEQGGPPLNRYCCGDGAGENPVDCTDARCTGGGNTCTP